MAECLIYMVDDKYLNNVSAKRGRVPRSTVLTNLTDCSLAGGIRTPKYRQ